MTLIPVKKIDYSQGLTKDELVQELAQASFKKAPKFTTTISREITKLYSQSESELRTLFNKEVDSLTNT